MNVFWARFNDTSFECGLCERGEQPDGDLAILVEVQRLGQLQAAWRLAETRIAEISYNLWGLQLGDEYPFLDESDKPF